MLTFYQKVPIRYSTKSAKKQNCITNKISKIHLCPDFINASPKKGILK